MLLLIPWFVCLAIFRIRHNIWPWTIVKGSAAYAVLGLVLILAEWGMSSLP
jgi:hypothetical protein